MRVRVLPVLAVLGAGLTVVGLGGLWLDTADRSDAASTRIAADAGNILDEAVVGEVCGEFGGEVCGDPALLVYADRTTGFPYWDGDEWMWCPAPMSGRDCGAPGTY